MTNWFNMNLISWLTLTLIITFLLTSVIHPVLIIFMMLIYNIILCMSMSMWKMNFIFPIMFFLMMISGLLIIFLYFSSLISNETPWKNYSINNLMITLMTMIPLLQWFSYTKNLDPSNLEYLSSLMNLKMNNPDHWTSPLFSPPLSNMTLICMILLLLIMMAVIKMCSPNIKTLRKLN